MKTLFLSGLLIVIEAIFLFNTSMAQQVYEYRNNAGRMVQSSVPPTAYENTHKRYPGKYKFIKSKEETANDIPLDFDIEKAAYEHGYFQIWGSVKGSKKNRAYKWVKVTFSLYGGRGGDLIAREDVYTEPKDIGPGQIGYITGYPIKCKISNLNVVEYKVTGK